MPNPVERISFFIPGFMQDRSQSNQGLTILEHEFIDKYEVNGFSNGYQCCVDFAEWNADWNAQAEHISRLMMGAADPQLLVICYSWGGGFGFTRFANALRDRGVWINCAILSDAVYHWGPRWMHGFRIPMTNAYMGFAQIKAYYPYFKWTRKLIDWHLLPPRPTIVIPNNVLRVESFYQENSSLHGHELTCVSPNTILNRHPIELRNHTSMDECPEFWNMCREKAAEMFVAQKPVRPKRPPKSKL